MLQGAFHICTLAWATLSLGDTPAGEPVVVDPLQVEGPLAETWRERLTERLIEGVERSGRPALRPGQASGSHYILRPTVTVDGRDFDVSLQLVDGRDGAVLSERSELCEVCAVNEVGDVLAAHAGILSEKLDALLRSPPVVVFDSTPAGAVVYLDGEPIGSTPVRREVSPGAHRARAELRGYVPLERHLDAVAGTEEQLDFPLQRTPRAQRVRVAGWALLAVGVPSTVAGVTLLALDERPYRRRCSGDYVDEFGNCRLRYDTLVAGISLTSVGLVTSIAGAVIVGRGRRRGRKRPVTAAVSWGGHSLGLTAHGRF